MTLKEANIEAEDLRKLLNDGRKSKKTLPKRKPFNEAGWAAYADEILGVDKNKPTEAYLKSIGMQTMKPQLGVSEGYCGKGKVVVVIIR